jgi:hypothetical protein
MYQAEIEFVHLTLQELSWWLSFVEKKNDYLCKISIYIQEK